MKWSLGYVYQCDQPDGILNIVCNYFRSVFLATLGSLLASDGWAIVLAVLVLGFTVMAFRNGAFDDSLLVMGLTFS